MVTPIGLICLAFFVVIVNPFGWHMIIHVAPLYIPFLLAWFKKMSFAKPRPVLCMSLFFLYAIISFLFISHGNGATSKILRYLYELVLIAVLFNVVLPSKKVAALNKFYILSCIAVVIKMAFQRVCLPGSDARYTIFNFIKLMDPNFLAGLFILPSLVLFYRAIHSGNRIKDILFLCILLFAILLTGSRGGLLSVLLGFCIILLKDASFKWKITSVAIGVLLLFVYSYFFVENFSRYSVNALEDSSNVLRFHLWSVGWEIFMSNPIFGRGANSMINLGLDYGARINIMIHNTYLEILADYGILGFVFWISIFVNILKKSFQLKNVLVYSILLSTAFCATFISAQDSAFWWQNLIISNAMLYYEPNDVIGFNYKLFR